MLETLEKYHPYLPDAVLVTVLLLAALAAYWIGNRVLVKLARKFASRSEQTWDDALIEHRVASRLAQAQVLEQMGRYGEAIVMVDQVVQILQRRLAGALSLTPKMSISRSTRRASATMERLRAAQ